MFFCFFSFGQQFPFAPMPPPPAPVNSNDVSHDSDALASMLMAWYLSGYHTGYYQVSDWSQYLYIELFAVAYIALMLGLKKLT